MTNAEWKVESLMPGSWRTATSVLLSNGSRYIVVDTGMPHEEHLLVNVLNQHGLNASDISAVINTHFHIDHVLNNSIFPTSEIYSTQESHDWCCSLYSEMRDEQDWEKRILKYYPEIFEYNHAIEHMQQLRKFTLRWWDPSRLGSPSQFRWLETNELPEGLETVVTSGHVPGHVSLVIPGAEYNTVVAGDACLSRAEDAEVLTMIPHSRKQFHLDRERVLALGMRIFPGHDVEFTKTEKCDSAQKAAETVKEEARS